MKIPFSRLRMTAYHMVVAAPLARIWNQGRGGSPPRSAMPASTSWWTVAT